MTGYLLQFDAHSIIKLEFEPNSFYTKVVPINSKRAHKSGHHTCLIQQCQQNAIDLLNHLNFIRTSLN
jgi:hypothetical protein